MKMHVSHAFLFTLVYYVRGLFYVSLAMERITTQGSQSPRLEVRIHGTTIEMVECVVLYVATFNWASAEQSVTISIGMETQ